MSSTRLTAGLAVAAMLAGHPLTAGAQPGPAASQAASAQTSASATGRESPPSSPALPTGFSATLFAEGLPTPRHIAVQANGDVYVTLRSGQAKFRPTDEPGGVMALRDVDDDGVADEARRFGSPDVDTGIAIHDGRLYFSSMTTIYTVPLDDELVPSAAAEIAVAELPESCCGHRSKPITFDGLGRLYTQVGAPSNACQAQQGEPGSAGPRPCELLDEHGGVFRYAANPRDRNHATHAERYSTGHRNLVALEWNDSAGALYALMHGRDGLEQLWPEHYDADDDAELPAEEFHRIDEGTDLGWPYTYFDPRRGERMLMPEYGGDGETPAEPGGYAGPLIAFPAHWAPNDLVFYTGTQFPERYRHGAFIAFHGAVAPRRDDVGSIVFVPMSADGDVTGDWEIFAGGFEHATTETGATGRPTGVAVGPEGELYVVDDSGGRIWKITY